MRTICEKFYPVCSEDLQVSLPISVFLAFSRTALLSQGQQSKNSALNSTNSPFKTSPTLSAKNLSY